jgi:hypothetical protein
VPPAVVEHIKAAALAIRNGKVPPKVLKAARGSTAHALPRRVIIRYLSGRDNDPCPPLR